ncbi:MAG: hypothetical protein PF692_05250 [Kiritimatiellae bacterium]|jgi:hypothetical protein|nr:hypothetical protein [Kiritimatiellia bacterium]
MRHIKILSIISLLIFGMSGIILAETYELRNGKSVEGEIARMEGEKVVFRTATGFASYQLDEFEYETSKGIRLRYGIKKTVETADTVSEAAQATFSDPEYLWVFGGMALIFIGYISFIISGFAESPIWGIAIIFANFLGGIAFTILHFRRARWPLLISVAGVAAMAFGIYQLQEFPL